jgi:CRISPR-associated protein Cas2
MADNALTQYLISYDIADPKRLSRVHRRLKKSGLPLQYSVFTALLRKRQLLELLDALERLIDSCEDDLRCYPLPERIVVDLVGCQLFPEDVMLFAAGKSLLGFC